MTAGFITGSGLSTPCVARRWAFVAGPALDRLLAQITWLKMCRGHFIQGMPHLHFHSELRTTASQVGALHLKLEKPPVLVLSFASPTG